MKKKERNGEYCEAIKLYDLARYNGYSAPYLYTVYSMAYHQLKDYDNEIEILEEGIKRFSNDSASISTLIARRDKAVQAIYKNIEQEKIAIQKLAEKEVKKRLKEEQKIKEKQEKAELKKNTPKQPVEGRHIIQMDDEGNIIREYISISEAERETGINSKSIRDTAKGIQKHAGGYCWKYKE